MARVEVYRKWFCIAAALWSQGPFPLRRSKNQFACWHCAFGEFLQSKDGAGAVVASRVVLPEANWFYLRHCYLKLFYFSLISSMIVNTYRLSWLLFWKTWTTESQCLQCIASQASSLLQLADRKSCGGATDLQDDLVVYPRLLKCHL